MKQGWLKSPRWDITFLIASAVIAFSPYAIYLLFGGTLVESAGTVGTSAYNARVAVNTLVAVFIGGPHMYATFTRTMMDPQVFNRRKWLYIATSIIVPLFVFGMAIASYETYVWLLTIFFGMASVHALHQNIWISDAYDTVSGKKVRRWAQAIDFGTIFFSLYPIAVWRMVEGDFLIGPISLYINDIIFGQYWIAILATVTFFAFLTAFIGKSIWEWRRDELHIGKTLLIGTSAGVMFFSMFLPNIDTAAQGVNTWHSFQYLALTWYAHKLIEVRKGKELGFLHFWKNLYQRAKDSSKSRLGFVKQLWVQFLAGMRKIDGDSGWSSFYLLTMAMLPLSSLIVIITGSLLPNLHGSAPGADEVYTYMGLLSILLIHYVHDALLFLEPGDIVLEESEKQNTQQRQSRVQPNLALA